MEIILDDQQLKELVQKIGGPENALKVLKGELIVPDLKNYTEENGMIFCSVTSHGFTKEQWIERFAKNGVKLEEGDFDSDFKITSGVTTKLVLFRPIVPGEENLWASKFYKPIEEHFVELVGSKPGRRSIPWNLTFEQVLLFHDKFIINGCILDFLKEGVDTVFCPERFDTVEFDAGNREACTCGWFLYGGSLYNNPLSLDQYLPQTSFLFAIKELE